MNLRQLYYFKAIAELEHYTRAAEKLYVSQSSLSHAIQELETELNVEFFVKKGRNVELTKYGKLFLPYVQKSIDTLEAGIAKLADYINPNTGAVVMGGFPSLAQFAPDIIVRYVSETNRVDVRLQFNQEATYNQLKEHLLEGKIDLVFATKIDDPRIASSYIGDHQLVLLVPKIHRLARYDWVDLSELDGENFIAFDADCQLRTVTVRSFKIWISTPTSRWRPLKILSCTDWWLPTTALQSRPTPWAVPHITPRSSKSPIISHLVNSILCGTVSSIYRRQRSISEILLFGAEKCLLNF